MVLVPQPSPNSFDGLRRTRGELGSDLPNQFSRYQQIRWAKDAMIQRRSVPSGASGSEKGVHGAVVLDRDAVLVGALQQ
jgi:hypothetical protein